MQHLDFELKPSRYARAVHMTVLMVIALITWPSLQLWAWCLLMVLAFSSYLLWRKQAQVTRLAQLDGALWSVQYQSNASMPSSALFHVKSKVASHAQRNAAATKREIKPHNSGALHRVQLLQVLDHAVYIVLRFEHSANVVIWPDQLPQAHWKQLKVLAKMY